MKNKFLVIFFVLLLVTALSVSISALEITCPKGTPDENLWDEIDEIPLANGQTEWYGDQTGCPTASAKFLYDNERLYIRIIYSQVTTAATGEIRITNKDFPAALGIEGPCIFVNYAECDFLIPGGVHPENIEFSKKTVDGKAIYDVALSWFEQPFGSFTPEAGAKLNLELSVNGECSEKFNDTDNKKFCWFLASTTEMINAYNYGTTENHAKLLLGDWLHEPVSEETKHAVTENESVSTSAPDTEEKSDASTTTKETASKVESTAATESKVEKNESNIGLLIIGIAAALIVIIVIIIIIISKKKK